MGASYRGQEPTEEGRRGKKGKGTGPSIFDREEKTAAEKINVGIKAPRIDQNSLNHTKGEPKVEGRESKKWEGGVLEHHGKRLCMRLLKGAERRGVRRMRSWQNKLVKEASEG